MKKSNYIPGFDWVRIVGSILVVLTHHGLFAYIEESYHALYMLLSGVVPIFFIMSGYLSGRHFSRRRILKQVIKYGAVYMFIETGIVLYMHLCDRVTFGWFSWVGFIVYSLKCLIKFHPWTHQLWFIPALLYSMIINAFLKGKGRKIAIAVSALLMVFYTLVGGDYWISLYEGILGHLPLFGMVFKANEIHQIIWFFIFGFLFTTIGFELPNMDLKPVRLLAIAGPLALFELLVKYLGAARILLSVALFCGVKKLPGKFLYKYHTEISVFSGTMFFMHTLEQRFIWAFISDNRAVSILLIISTHLLLAAVVHYVIIFKEMLNQRHRKVAYELQ